MTKAFWAIVCMFAIAAAAYAYVVYWTNPRPLPEVVACTQALPNAKDIGISFDITNGKEVTAKFGQSITPGSRRAEDAVAILDAMSRCVAAVRGATFAVERGSAIVSEEAPIGALASIWQADQSGAVATFSLNSEGDRRPLNNLRIGPDAGPKSDILSRWCASNRACVQCKETRLSPNLVSFNISLKPDAKIKEVPMAKQPWPIPAPGSKPSDWNLVDASGRRTIYQCVNDAG